MNNYLLTNIDDSGVATLTMNRPEVHNAFDDSLIALMISELKRLESDRRVRLLILAACGKSFSAGADLGWMKRMAEYSRAENLNDALQLAELMKRLDRFSKPTVALVQGAAYGGGVGLVACCDMVIASDKASFCLSEVKLGLIPAVISPYVVSAIGARNARRYFLSAERFGAQEGQRLNLVHEVVEPDALKARADEYCALLLKNSPAAMAAAKKLVAVVARGSVDEAMILDTAERIADTRASAEGRDGLAAFFEKRQPNWVKG
ncbi:MAG: enoyl-CoA hydratase/isomerase family protein [Desulfuromonadales bacterium]|nr:enoyl-CoA hydratase/isomerase family protein [Desulfuromonadales bacterium]